MKTIHSFVTTAFTAFLLFTACNTAEQKNTPTGTWVEVKGLALPGQLIEIDMEVHKPASAKL